MTKSENPQPSDEHLMDQYLADPQGRAGCLAADQLLARYQSRVYQWCRGFSRDADEAFDLAQEVLISAFKGLPGFDRRALFSSWLFAITRNRCLTEVARRKMSPEPLDSVPEPAARTATAEEVLLVAQDEKALRLLMGSQLDPSEEEAFWLRIVEGMSVDQITRTLRLKNASGARGILQSARRKLRRAWGDQVDDFPGVD